MRDATERKGRAGRVRIAGVRRVSIQLPRISSGRGDSPSRICHLRGRDCPRMPAHFSKYYDNIYPRAVLSYIRLLVNLCREIKRNQRKIGLFISLSLMN